MSFDWNATNVKVSAAVQMGIDVDGTESEVPSF